MNNADSFAIAFDEAWKTVIAKAKETSLDQTEKINLVLCKIEDHPFLIENPEKAREVAIFRIKLLNLK